jgi:hypothetical protein
MPEPLKPPPAGSVFHFEVTDDGYNRVSWPTGAAWYLRLLPAGFLSVWLIGWAVGEFAVAGILLGILFGKAPMGVNVGADPISWFIVGFLLLWLTFWTIGGMGAMFALHFLLKRPRDEAVTLGDDELQYDPGSAAIGVAGRMPNRQHSFRQWLKSQRPQTIARTAIDQVNLRWVPGRQQLTLDMGVDRLEIGANLSEPEREWLGQALATWAGLPLTGNATSQRSDET